MFYFLLESILIYGNLNSNTLFMNIIKDNELYNNIFIHFLIEIQLL